MGISFEFDVDNLVTSIVVHPNAPEWYFRVVKQVAQKFAPQLSEKVHWSSMKSTPKY